MIKHKGFPSRMPGTDFQFTVRHFKNKVPPIIERKRKLDVTYRKIWTFEENKNT